MTDKEVAELVRKCLRDLAESMTMAKELGLGVILMYEHPGNDIAPPKMQSYSVEEVSTMMSIYVNRSL